MNFAKRGRGRAANGLACWPVGLYQPKKKGVPGGHSLLCSLWRSSGLGKGAPVRVPPAGGPRPTRPSGLRADTLPTLGGGGAAARPVQPLQVWPG